VEFLEMNDFSAQVSDISETIQIGQGENFNHDRLLDEPTTFYHCHHVCTMLHPFRGGHGGTAYCSSLGRSPNAHLGQLLHRLTQRVEALSKDRISNLQYKGVDPTGIALEAPLVYFRCDPKGAMLLNASNMMKRQASNLHITRQQRRFAPHLHGQDRTASFDRAVVMHHKVEPQV
jgi:hypothetical protein